MFKLKKKANLCLPAEYQVKDGLTSYVDVPGEFTYQPHVYAFAKHLAERSGARWIVDIGCGSARKLVPFSEKFQIIAVDAAHGIELAKEALPNAKLIEFDLENGLPHIPDDVLREAIVICSDVIEHLRQPKCLLTALASIAEIAPYVLISTPDRDRARGWLDNGPPGNPAHVMEWAANEFVRFMRSCGFKNIEFYGHTINTDFHRAKSTILALAGVETVCVLSNQNREKDFCVAAVIHTYNELDSIGEVIDHLRSQGVDVHLFDNWSTDGTWEFLCGLKESGRIANLERFPAQPKNQYQWNEQLRKTAEYAQSLKAHWVIHHDADEIRVAPWQSVSLRDAIYRVDELGYNAIDFTVLDFRYLASRPDPKPPYQQSMTHFEFGHRPGHFLQIKAWKNTQAVELASSGGHEAQFEGRRVYPLKFLLKHYPLRNRIQAKNKVFIDRLPRFTAEKERYGWHVQYDQYAHSNEISGWSIRSLQPWHPVHFMNEFLVERISGIGIQD